MSGQTRIHILHTNDIHSHVEEMPRVKSVIDRLCRELNRTGEHVFLVDVGDHMDRVRVETEGTQGAANRKVMDTTGYQMVTLGNNELLTFSKEELSRLYRDAPFEVVAANVEELEGGRPQWMKPWTVAKADGFRIGFAGVTIPFPVFYRLLGWQVRDPFEVLATQVPRWKREVDVLVLLSHLGWNNDLRLARDVPGIDVILGSHTHHLLEAPERIHETWIAAAGKFGEHVGHVTLTMDTDTRRLKQFQARCLPTRDAEADPVLQEQIRLSRQEALERLSRPICELTRPLPVDWYRESPLGNFLADGLRDWVDSDLALVNAGQLLEGLEKGPVSKGRLHQICPHPINPCRVVLTGGQIRKTLEESLLHEYQHLEIRGFGFRGKRLGILNLSGVVADVENEAPPYQKIRSLRVEGEPIREDGKYRVATIDMFTFGVGYGEIQKGEDLRYYLPEFLRDILAHWLQQPRSVEKSFIPRWRPF